MSKTNNRREAEACVRAAEGRLGRHVANGSFVRAGEEMMRRRVETVTNRDKKQMMKPGYVSGLDNPSTGAG